MARFTGNCPHQHGILGMSHSFDITTSTLVVQAAMSCDS